MDIITWIVSHIQVILSVLFGVIFVCSLIVKLTPNTKDDEVLTKIIGFLDHFSVVKTAKDKDLLERAKKNIEGNSV